MARAWLIDGRSIAKKVSNVNQCFPHQIKDCGANRECPKCHHRIDNSDVSQEWPGLPAGVKFDPSDLQLLDHLAAKCGVGSFKSHTFIDEFIPTLADDKGICYAHPGKLPGAKKDGSSVHFFHRTVHAYATGRRKRRRVHYELSSNEDSARWHKTGKTNPVMDNGLHRGYKKIMVLYKCSKKGVKPVKSNWVMYQFHLGTDEDEKQGEYVVSKIFYKQKRTDKNDEHPVIEDNEFLPIQASPRTPNPNPPRAGKFVMYDDVVDAYIMQTPVQEKDIVHEASYIPAPTIQLEDDVGYPECPAGESQAVDDPDFNGIDDSLLCKEIFNNSCFLPNDWGLNHASYSGFPNNTNELTGSTNPPCGIAELENLELDIQPDFQLSDLQLGSEDSILGWIVDYEDMMGANASQ